MMNLDQAKLWLSSNVPKEAYNPVITYTVQLVVIQQLLQMNTKSISAAMEVSADLRERAKASGASEQVLNSVQMFAPAIAQFITAPVK
jgi:hypothetical protein